MNYFLPTNVHILHLPVEHKQAKMTIKIAQILYEISMLCILHDLNLQYTGLLGIKFTHTLLIRDDRWVERICSLLSMACTSLVKVQKW